MSQTINAAGVSIIKDGEGLVLTATPDPTGVLTIGYGHTVGVYAGETITEAQAQQLLAQDLLLFEASVSSVAQSPSSNEFSAMVSLAYNIGSAAFRSSTVLKDHNAGNKQGAAAAFLLWDKAHVNGQLVELPGLLKRRQEESALYLTPDAPPAPLPTDTTLATFETTSGTVHIIERTVVPSASPPASSGGTALRCSIAAVALGLGLCVKPSEPARDPPTQTQTAVEPAPVTVVEWAFDERGRAFPLGKPLCMAGHSVIPCGP